MQAVIFSGGKINSSGKLLKTLIKKDAFVISADSGLDNASLCEITSDVFIGDRDSVSDKGSELIKNLNIDSLLFPKDKDKTDGELALEFAESKGFDEILVAGGLGSERPDHVLHMLSRLLSSAEGGRNCLYSDGNSLIICFSSEKKTGTYSNTKDFHFKGEFGNDPIISVLPYGDPLYGVSISGLQFELNEAYIESGSGLSLSNRIPDINSDRSEINFRFSLEKGRGFLFILPSDKA